MKTTTSAKNTNINFAKSEVKAYNNSYGFPMFKIKRDSVVFDLRRVNNSNGVVENVSKKFFVDEDRTEQISQWLKDNVEMYKEENQN